MKDNTNIDIKLEKDKIIIKGLQFTFLDRLKFLIWTKHTKIIFNNPKLRINEESSYKKEYTNNKEDK